MWCCSSFSTARDFVLPVIFAYPSSFLLRVGLMRAVTTTDLLTRLAMETPVFICIHCIQTGRKFQSTSSPFSPGRGGSLRMEDGVFENFTGGFIARHLPSVGWSRSWKK